MYNEERQKNASSTERKNERKKQLQFNNNCVQLEIQECGCCDAKFIGIKLINSQREAKRKNPKRAKR